MGLTTKTMSGKTLNKQLKWNLHHSHLCQNISQPHSLKIFCQDYLWQSHLLYISKRYEIDKIKTTRRRTCSVSEGSRDFSVLKWLLCTKSPNLFNFTGLKILMFSFKPSQDFQVLLFHQNTLIEGFSVKCREICKMYWLEKPLLILEKPVARFPVLFGWGFFKIKICQMIFRSTLQFCT